MSGSCPIGSPEEKDWRQEGVNERCCISWSQGSQGQREEEERQDTPQPGVQCLRAFRGYPYVPYRPLKKTN